MHNMQSQPDIPKSMPMLSHLLSQHTPLSLTEDDCVLIGQTVVPASYIAGAAD